MLLERFISAQENIYDRALHEIKNGKKQSHWMWFIFPQIQGLGSSEMNIFYALKDMGEATAYLNHPLLGSGLIEISNEVLRSNAPSAEDIFGYPDTHKLCSCMTVFSECENTHPAFISVLDKYFNGRPDLKTLKLLGLL